jgi:hypothetical protein
MALIAIILKLIIAQKGMRCQWNIINGSSSQEEYVAVA